MQYDESLSSLVQASYAINQNLQGHPATGSVVLLLRNDVFARISLSLPDSQKMRDDHSVDLDWRVLSGSAGRKAPLMRLVNAKASRLLEGAPVEVLGYFPTEIELAREGRGRSPQRMDMLRYALNLTRHTPRDLLRLFEEIRKVEASDIYPSSTGAHLASEVIREGVLQYATKYFVGAIRNEFAGFEGGPEAAAAALSALQHLEKQVFSRDEFVEALRGESNEDPDRMLALLFYAGAIGNLVQRHSNKSYMQFYHRRDDSEIYLKGSFILHSALIHAWGMPRGG